MAAARWYRARRPMRHLAILVLLGAGLSCATPAKTDTAAPPAPAPQAEPTELEARAARVTIVRDNWGIPHIYGKTDADVVFGLMYAQAEDDFNRVEVNFLNAMGRLAEYEGEDEIYRDLRMKLFIDPDVLQAEYEASPDWLKSLMDAWAAGLNYYLETHPETKPKVLTHFEPWMALSFSEGSIGGDIERVNLTELGAFYGKEAVAVAPQVREDLEPRGSNGIAIAPAKSASGNALLLINPHTSFFFRTEVHLVSEEGLNVYGAVTWGQFFVYQGFNENAGWMHTSSRADAIDWYLETIEEKDGVPHYRYGDELRPLEKKQIEIPFFNGDGMSVREFTTWRSHHGPIVKEKDGKWVAIRLMEEPRKALTQSYLRMKAKDHASYDETMDLHTNSSNNTVYADSSGNIAYWHGNFIPIRDPKYDWNEMVDGSDPGTDWQGLHETKDLVTLLNPKGGWIQNTNNTPYSAAGEDSPKAKDYRPYMAPDAENARGVHAVKLLSDIDKVTVDSLIATAYDPEITGLLELIPALIKAYDRAPRSSPHKKALKEQIELLRGWDIKWSKDSVPTSLAIYWIENLWKKKSPEHPNRGSSLLGYILKKTSNKEKLQALAEASAKLEADFGNWKTPWGEINRFQRVNGEIVQPFDDAKPSIPVGFVSARWGSLASFGARSYPKTKRMYGTAGNSFVAVIEFGKDRVRAKAVLSGGISGDPGSPHFGDQAQMYADGQFRDVLFYREDVEKAAERTYHPGQ